jgi:hypothetical protein
VSYSTNTTIISYFAALPQTTTSAGFALISGRITSHITRADTIINSKIARRYSVSDLQVNVPPVLRTLSEDISSYFTFRAMFSQDNKNVNDWTEKFNEAMTLLDEIRDGNCDLVNTAGSIIPEITSATSMYVDSTTKDYQSYFDEDDPTDWKVDIDKKSSIRDGR